MSRPEPSKAVVLAAAQGLDPESPTSLQAVCTRLSNQGYAISVMASGSGQPSDHKVWWEGAGWTFISSDGYKPGTYRWDPYIQVPADGSGWNGCGIPLSLKQACPSWWAATQPSGVPVPPPVVTPAPPPAVVTPQPASAPVVPSAPVIPLGTPSWLAWTERIISWIAQAYKSR